MPGAVLFLLLRFCPESLNDGVLQLLPSGVVHPALAALRHLIGFPEGDPPVQEQPQPCPHGVGAGFHHHELPLGDGLQLVRGHKGPFRHLEGLAVLPLAPADGAGLHGVATQCLRQHLGRLAVGGKAAENGVLAVVLNDLRALLS